MRKRLIYRCDDVGYTPVYDAGIFNVIDAGIGCSADVMFDAMNAPAALRMLRERPWVSVGWHRHLWERPVLPPEEVPSLVDENGRFKWGHRKNELKAEATYEDARREFEAELEMCRENLGRYPDVAPWPRGDVPMEHAFIDVLAEHGVAMLKSSWTPRQHGSARSIKDIEPPEGAALAQPVDGSTIISVAIGGPMMHYDLETFKDYHPLERMTSPVWEREDQIFFYGWHPGFIDDHILLESTSTVHRIREYIDAMGDEYRSWIIENGIELINFRDALYGTNELQDHLKEIGSPLYVGER